MRSITRDINTKCILYIKMTQERAYIRSHSVLPLIYLAGAFHKFVLTTQLYVCPILFVYQKNLYTVNATHIVKYASFWKWTVDFF